LFVLSAVFAVAPFAVCVVASPPPAAGWLSAPPPEVLGAELLPLVACWLVLPPPDVFAAVSLSRAAFWLRLPDCGDFGLALLPPVVFGVPLPFAVAADPAWVVELATELASAAGWDLEAGDWAAAGGGFAGAVVGAGAAVLVSSRAANGRVSVPCVFADVAACGHCPDAMESTALASDAILGTA